MPTFPIHYIGDSAWCPYGNKGPEVIRDRVFYLADALLEQGAELLVIACNSATIHGVGALRASYPIPVVGMEPGVKPAAEKTRTGVVGVLATEASLAGEKFHRLVTDHAEGVRVITQPCPRFVELVEAGILTGPEAEAAIDAATVPLLSAGADVLVLGCTHYPFLRPVIEQRIPQEVAIIDTGEAVARRVAEVMPEREEIATGAASIQIETTGSLEELDRVLPILIPEIVANTSASGL